MTYIPQNPLSEFRMKESMKRKCISIAVLGLLAGYAMASPLEPELRKVLTEHPGLKAARNAASASERRAEAARGALKPRITVSGDKGREQIESTAYRPDVQGSRSVLGTTGPMDTSNYSQLTRSQLALSVEQMIYDGGRRQSQVTVADLDREIQALNYQSQIQDVLVEAITAYMQVARYLTLIRLASLNEETTRQQLELERKRLEGGGGIAVDVLQARTRLQIVRERRVFYEQGLRDAAANYEQVFGRPPATDTIQDLLPFEARMPASVIAAISKGLDQNVRMRIAEKQIERARTQIEAERAGFMPRLDLVGARTSGRNVMQMQQRDETSLLFKFSWNVYAGGETANLFVAAVKDHEEQVDRFSVTRNKVTESIRMAWNQMVNGNERLELLDSAASIARDVMENRKRLRDAGKEPAINVLDSEVEYYGVLANKVNALFDTRINSYRLLSLLGELTPETVGLDGGFKLPVKPLSVDLQAISAPIKR